MATYVQGVPNLLPQIQPFQPDLNFYANALQTKQNQYDTNWKALNNLYGQFYYADLTRDNNIEKKENLLKNIDFNLKRVAGLDLSLDQNVTQATQVFKPFYEDKTLMKDMAWTKNYMTHRNRANGLKNAEDEKMRSQYWGAGIRELDYRREEFRETTDEESMNFANVSYTPYMNVNKEALKIAKEAGLSVESVDFSPDGKWIVKKKNGQPLMAPLQKLFESTLGKDPRVMDVYRTQSYVNRKDYAYNNAAQFGGDHNRAEMQYLEKNYTMLRDLNEKRLKELREESRVNDAQQKDVEKQINEGTALPTAGTYLDNLREAQGINNSVLEQSEETNEQLSNGSSTLSTSTGFNNPYGDIKSLRQKVDAGMASLLMQKDLGEAAYIYAHRDMKMDIQANPYKVLEIKQANRMAALSKKKKNDEELLRIKHGLADGILVYDKQTGEYIEKPDFTEVKTEFETQSTSDEVNMIERGEFAIEENFRDSGTNRMLTGILQMIEQGKANGTVNNEDVKKIFGYNINLERFWKGLKEDGAMYMSKHIDLQSQYDKEGKENDNYLGRIAQRTKDWMLEKQNLSVVRSYAGDISPYINSAALQGENMQQLSEIKSQVKNVVMDKLEQQGFDPSISEDLFDKNNNLRNLEHVKAKFNIDIEEESKGLPYQGSPIGANWGAGALWSALKWVGNLGDTKAGIITKMGLGQGTPKDYLNLANKVYNEKIEEVHQKAKKLLSKSETYKNVDKLPFLGSYGKGSGLSSLSASIMVPPQSWGTAGNFVWNHFAQNFPGADVGSEDVALTLSGRSKESFDKAIKNKKKDDAKQHILHTILNDLIAESSASNNKLDPFKVKAHRVAAGDPDKSAIIITPSRDFLKEYIDDTDDPAGGTITSAEAAEIGRNGISFIGNQEDAIFDNPLLDGAYSDPITSLIQSRNEPYIYEDFAGMGSIKMFKTDKSPSGIGYHFKSWSGEINENGEKIYDELYGNPPPDADLLNYLNNTIVPAWRTVENEYVNNAR